MNNLTGKTRYRSNWRGKLILQVEYTYTRFNGFDEFLEATDWRDAKITDINLDVKCLYNPEIKS